MVTKNSTTSRTLFWRKRCDFIVLWLISQVTLKVVFDKCKEFNWHLRLQSNWSAIFLSLKESFVLILLAIVDTTACHLLIQLGS